MQVAVGRHIGHNGCHREVSPFAGNHFPHHAGAAKKFEGQRPREHYVVVGKQGCSQVACEWLKSKEAEESGIGKHDPLLEYGFLAMLQHHRHKIEMETDGGGNLGKAGLQLTRQCSLGGRPMLVGPLLVDVVLDPKNLVGLGPKPIVTQFVNNIQRDEHGREQSGSKSGQVDGHETFMILKTAESGEEDVFNHEN